MKKYILWLAGILVVVGLLVFIAKANAETKALKVVHSSSYYPYSYFNEKQEPTGLLIDFWKLWSEKNKVDIEISLHDWNQALQMVKDGEADIVGGAFLTEARKPYFDFSEPIMRVKTGVFVFDKLPINKMVDLETYEVGVIKGDYAEEYLQVNYPFLKLKTFANIEEIFKALESQELKAFTMDYNDDTLATIYLKFAFIKNYKLLEAIISSEYRAAVKKGSLDLVELVNKGIDKSTP
jgi:ABC-type amino acid transport substrate-binding protein